MSFFCNFYVCDNQSINQSINQSVVFFLLFMSNVTATYFETCLQFPDCVALYTPEYPNFLEHLTARIVAFGIKYGQDSEEQLINLLESNANNNNNYTITQKLLLLMLETCEYGTQLNLRKMTCDTMDNINFQNTWGVDPQVYTGFIIGIVLITICFVLVFATCILYSNFTQRIKKNK